MNLIIILSIIFILIDQFTKIIVINKYILNHSIEVINNFLYITYTHNTGAAFSILTGKRILLIIVALVILFILFKYLKNNNINNKLEKISYSLIIGGSIGNLIDRIFRGYVIDFIDIKIFNYNYPIFNIADTFIVVGIILLMIILFRKEDNSGSRGIK